MQPRAAATTFIMQQLSLNDSYGFPQLCELLDFLYGGDTPAVAPSPVCQFCQDTRWFLWLPNVHRPCPACSLPPCEDDAKERSVPDA